MESSAGDKLPEVFKALGTPFLRGQLCLVCAAPGIGKSALILTYAVKSGVPTFYFSADSDDFIMSSRMLSIKNGWTMDKSFAARRSKNLPPDVESDLASTLIRFNYESNPTLDDIKESLKAYEEVFGDYPELIVVDNVTNVLTELNAEDPFAGLEVLMEQLHALARITGACIIGLHHVTGEFNDGNKPISLKGIKNQIGRVPELVLTLFKPVDGSLGVSTVKNRSGVANPSGEGYVTLSFDGSRMQIKDFQ